MTFQQFLLILKARCWLIAIILAVVVSLTLTVSLLLPEQYTATATLLVDIKMTDQLGTPQASQGQLATQIDIIRSERVAKYMVAQAFELAKEYEKFKNSGSAWGNQHNDIRFLTHPYQRELWQKETKGMGGGDEGFQAWLGRLLQRGLDVRPSTTRDSNIVSINFQAPDPGSASKIANAFAQAYMDTNVQLKVNPATENSSWFKEQTAGVLNDLKAAQSKLSKYEQDNSVLAGDGRFDVESMRLAELNSQLSVAVAQDAESSSRSSQVGSSHESLPEVMASPVVAGLKTELARLKTERGQLSERFGPNHPVMLELNERIAEQQLRLDAEIQRVVNSIGTTSRISKARIKEMEEAVEKQKAVVLQLKGHRDQIAVLLRDIESAQKAYDLVIQSLAKTNLESQTQQTNISMLTPAMPPLKPSSPKVVLNTIISMFLGILLGIGVALLLELIDQRVRGIEDLVQNMGVPLLGVIPGFDKPRRRFSFRAPRRPVVA